jgi:flagellin-like hook-associated protein FlgL
LNEKGRLNITDNKNSPTKMEFSIYSTSLESTFFNSVDESINNSGTTQTFSVVIDGTTYSLDVSDGESVSKFISDINNGLLKDSSGNSLNLKAYFKSGHIYLDFSQIEGNIDSIDDSNLLTDFKYRDDASLSFQANDAITIDSAENDFFETLQKAIEAVESGNNFANAFSNNPRNFGIQGAIEAIDHVMDRVRRSHAKIGAVSQEFDMTIQRVEMLKINVESLQSDNLDTDIGEAAMQLNSLQVSYQALLASISKISNLTLLNYLR